MAFRIHDSVVRGEIDNRVKGTVRGTIWLEGRADPILLDLNGNAWPDLAGCLLTFSNSQTRIPDPSLDCVSSIQRGTAGDMTASRKVRVSDAPLEAATDMLQRDEKPPEHMANCLYLEWFSEVNGRVVIETVDYELTLSAPEWRMTREENEERERQAAAAMDGFMQKLTEKLERHHLGLKNPEDEWDEHDYEKFLKERDASTDKYMELLDKYGHSEDAQARIAKEMGWEDRNNEVDAERGEGMSIEEINAMCEAAANQPLPEPDPHREGIDWIRDESGELLHPLQHQCFEAAIKFHCETKRLGFDVGADYDLDQFIFELQTTSAKLAGALNSIVREATFPEPAFTIACLKRALDHLHKSQAGLESAAPKEILPESMIAEARKELFEIREGILRLMDELRGRA